MFEVKRTLNRLAIRDPWGAGICRCLQVLARGQGKQAAAEHIFSGKKNTHSNAPWRTPSSGLSLSNKSRLRTGDVCALKLLNLFIALLESSLGPKGCLFVSLHHQLLGC